MKSFAPYLDKPLRCKTPVLHISLNPHPDDKLSEQQYSDIAREYVERMGYGDQPYVVFLHEDIDRKHMHIITSRVKLDGKMISDRFEYERSEHIRESLEKKHGLIPARGSKAKEWELRRLDYPRGYIKEQIGSVVRNVLERYSFESVQGLNALLSTYNVEIEERKGTVERNGKDYRGFAF